jgi:hypothetical protein
VGGTIFSTALTVFVVPAASIELERLHDRLRALARRGAAPERPLHGLRGETAR